eukprot:7381465-Prymnesium_polylepis.2
MCVARISHDGLPPRQTNYVQTFDCKEVADKVASYPYKETAQATLEAVQTYDYKGKAEAAVEHVRVMTPRAVEAVKTYDYKGAAKSASDAAAEGAQKAAAGAQKAAGASHKHLESCVGVCEPHCQSCVDKMTQAVALTKERTSSFAEAAKAYDYKGKADEVRPPTPSTVETPRRPRQPLPTPPRSSARVPSTPPRLEHDHANPHCQTLTSNSERSTMMPLNPDIHLALAIGPGDHYSRLPAAALTRTAGDHHAQNDRL